MIIKISKILKSEDSLRREIRKRIKKDDMDFVNSFLEIAKMFDWIWYSGMLNEDGVLKNMENAAYRILKSNEKSIIENGKITVNKNTILFINSGRLVSMPNFLGKKSKKIEISFSTTL